MTYDELGRNIKADHPGDYEDWDDDEIGRVYASKHNVAIDELRTMEVVPNLTFKTTEFHNSQLLDQELNDVIFSGNPSYWWGWIRRNKMESWTKTNDAKIDYVMSLTRLLGTQAAIWQKQVELNRFPELIRRQHNIQDLQYRQTIIQMQTAEKSALVAYMLVNAAAAKGWTLEIYLRELDRDLELEHTKKQDDQKLLVKEKELHIQREHERKVYLAKIMNARLAKNEAVQLRTQIREELDKLHDDIDRITNDKTISDYRRQTAIRDRQSDILFYEEHREHLRKRFGASGTGEDA